MKKGKEINSGFRQERADILLVAVYRPGVRILLLDYNASR
jgi:hypothetical protein